MRRRLAGSVARLAAVLGISMGSALALVGLLGGFLVVLVGFGGLTEDVAAHNGQQHLDLRRLDWFVHHRTGHEISAATWVSRFGAVGSVAVLAVLAAAFLWWRRESIAVVLAPIAAVGLAGVAVSAGKTLLDRARPPISVRLVSDTEPSFPSGHTTATTAVVLTLVAILAVVVLRRPLLRALSVAAGVVASALVGLSRLVLAAHWPTDVAAGWLLGSAIAALVLGVALVLSPRLPSGPDLVHQVVDAWHGRRRGTAPPDGGRTAYVSTR